MFYVCSAVSDGRRRWQRTSIRARGRATTASARSPASATTSRPARSPRSTRPTAASPGRRRGPTPCYSGTVTTAGNLVFVGRNAGELQAYDARNGDQLWSFQTGAGANDTVSVFEQDGKQYVAFLSGGQLARGHPARRQPLAVLARRHDRPGAGPGHRHRHRARRRGRRRRAAAADDRRRGRGQDRLLRQLRWLPRRDGTAATAAPT